MSSKTQDTPNLTKCRVSPIECFYIRSCCAQLRPKVARLPWCDLEGETFFSGGLGEYHQFLKCYTQRFGHLTVNSKGLRSRNSDTARRGSWFACSVIPGSLESAWKTQLQREVKTQYYANSRSPKQQLVHWVSPTWQIRQFLGSLLP